MIGDDIEVTVVDIRGEKVRLGFAAPKSVAVHRKEVWLEIRQEARENPEPYPNLAAAMAAVVRLTKAEAIRLRGTLDAMLSIPAAEAAKAG